MDQSDQFLVHTKNRSIRVAFVIDVANTNKAFLQIERITSYSSQRWGGRLFQIIPSKLGKISDEWMQHLKEYDADIIYSKTLLSDSTIKKIALKLNPSSLEIDLRDFISMHADPIDVLPDAANTAFLWRNAFQEYTILDLHLVESRVRIPAYIRKFIKLNFGQLSDGYLTERLTAGHVTRMDVTNKGSLIRAMVPLTGWNKDIYPMEYSFIPGIEREVRNSHDDEGMRTLFIGDDPLDAIYYWNNALRSPEWLSTRTINVWLPTKFLEDPQLLAQTKLWMDKFRTTGNSNDPQRLKVRSASLSLRELNVYADRLTNGLHYSTDVKKISGPPGISYTGHISIDNNLDSYSVAGDSFNITVRPVDQLQGGRGGQQWMTDFYIERRNPDHRVVNPRQYWLLFPKYNALAYSTLGKMGARVNRLGQPSSLMTRGEGMMTVKIPDDRNVLSNLLMGSKYFPYYNGDPRDKFAEPAFNHYGSSQSGRSLRGFTQLFGGFMEAAHFFENPYWRRVFMTMAGRDPSGDSTLNKMLRNVLKTNIKKILDQRDVTERSVDVWVKRVQQYSRDLKMGGEEKDFTFFETEFLNEIAQYNALNGEAERYTDRNKRGLKDNLSSLIEMKMIQIGIRYKCFNCGLKSFYEVDRTSTHNQCIGCGAEFTINAEEQWFYRLNSIASVNGAIYSQIPLIIALGALYEQSQYSFYPYSPVDIYTGSRMKHLTDLDLVALIDGKLVIGEVKNVQSLFTDGDFEKLYQAAKRLRPDRVVLTSLDETLDANNRRRIEELQNRLKAFDVKVEWLQLPPTVFMLYPQGIWSW